MRFQVPQFIEIESKLFGPLTLKQFIYLAGAAGMLVLLYAALPFFLVVLIGVPVIAFSLALAFYRVNNQPFIKVVENALKFYSSGRLYLWRKEEEKKAEAKKESEKSAEEIYIPKLTQSKLQDLSWSLDINKEDER